MKISEQIKTEEPGAYEYLQGTKGMERIGAGFIAILSAVFYAMFDITASLLVLLGFLIFRWAVVAAPILGTVGLLRPASGGVRRLVNAVVAAVFNIIIFGTGAAGAGSRGRTGDGRAGATGPHAGVDRTGRAGRPAVVHDLPSRLG